MSRNQRAPESCIECKKPFRHPSQSVEDHPGTVLHSSKGRCRTDYSQYRKKFMKDDKPVSQDGPRSSMDEIQAGLESFLSRRRQRVGA